MPANWLNITLFTILCFYILPSHAQVERFNKEDIVFFQQKSEAFQRWMDKSGLGIALGVTKVRLKQDSTSLELLLQIRSTDLDTAIALWNRVKVDFSPQGSQVLEHKLFRTFVQFMEIPSSQGNVQIYVLDEYGDYIPCFYVAIWEDAGLIKIESRIGECKDKPIEVKLQPVAIKKTSKGKTTEIQKKLNSSQVFDGIEKYFRDHYMKTTCYDRYPELIIEVKTEYTLRLSISDLCRIVLTDEQKSLWCEAAEALGWQCNDIKRERLEFEFHYQSENNQLTGRLVGKFGSGIYKPRKSGYSDMEPDFNDYLETFHLTFQQELKKHLDKL